MVLLHRLFYGMSAIILQHAPKRRLSKARLRLDPDERIYAESKIGLYSGSIGDAEHAGGLHIMPYENSLFSVIPDNFRIPIEKIFSAYAEGVFQLENGKWVHIQK